DCIFHNFRPGLIGFAQGNGIGMARPAIAAESLIGLFGHVRPPHYHRNSRRPNGISHAIRPGDHPGHGTNAHEPDVLVADELRNFSLLHGLGISIDQQNFMSWRSERLEQKHPQVGHEVAGDTVVRAVEQNSHDTPWKLSLVTLSPSRRFGKAGIYDVFWCLPVAIKPIKVAGLTHY